MNTGGWELIVALAGFLVVAAGVIGVNFRVNRSASNVANYRDAAQSWETKARAQETAIADLESQIEVLKRELAAEKAAREVLEGVVTGRTAVEELSRELRTMFTNLVTREQFSQWLVETRLWREVVDAKLAGNQ